MTNINSSPLLSRETKENEIVNEVHTERVIVCRKGMGIGEITL